MMLQSAVRSARGKLGLGWDRIVRSGPSGVSYFGRVYRTPRPYVNVRRP